MPTNIPPSQNITSPIIRDIVETVILVLLSISRNGIIAIKRKNGIQRTIKNIPAFIVQFFVFISQIQKFDPGIISNMIAERINPILDIINTVK